MKIGLVFEGGGGKGAYQVGAWRAIRELNIEDSVTVVSGTSVGGLNAALFMQGNLELAEDIWNNISSDCILPLYFEDCHAGTRTALSSQSNIKELLVDALSGISKKRKISIPCFVTCKEFETGYLEYFNLSNIIDPIYKQSILLASSAIPLIYDPVMINGKSYIDGGVNGDNTPISPVYEYGVDKIIVVHLSSESNHYTPFENASNILHIFPTQDLGGLLSGTLNFDASNAKCLYEYGYFDAKKFLNQLAIEINDSAANANSQIGCIMQSAEKSTKKAKGPKRKGDFKMENITFQSPEIQQKYNQRFEELRKIANATWFNPDVMWNATASKYASIIGSVREMLQVDELQDNVPSRIDKNIEMFLKKCSSPDFHIALVGAIKAGKSTLINAILGSPLASTEITPETAALTKFRGSNRGNYVSITFYDQSEWNVLWKSVEEYETSVFKREFNALNAHLEIKNWISHAPVEVKCEPLDELATEIKKWTSSQSPAHFFVKEVEVGLENFDLPNGVVLVDTPGLNDAVAYRSEVTKNYINRANAVFVCVKADALTGSEFATICSVFANARYNPEKIYILATQQDSLNDPIGDWKKQRINWLQHLEQNVCYGNRMLAEKNLIPISAYFYSLLKKQDVLERKQKLQLHSTMLRLEISPDELSEKYDDLVDFTSVELLKQRMKSEIVAKHSDLLIEDLQNSYRQCKEELEEFLKNTRDRQLEMITISQKSLEDIRKEQAKNQERLREAEADQKEFAELTFELKKMSQKRSAELVKAIKSLEV